MTTTDRPAADRLAVVNYDRAAMTIRSYSRTYAALAVSITEDPELLTFAAPLKALLVRTYEGLAQQLDGIADDAQACADSAREHLGVPA